MDRKYKLAIHLVPQLLWYRNLRALMSKYEWTKLRKKIISERGLRCEICGFVTHQSRDICCHEKWSYETEDDPFIARLTGIELTCRNCHSIEHWGNTESLVSQGILPPETIGRLVAHFVQVNGATADEFETHKQKAVGFFSRCADYAYWEIDWGPFKDWVEETYDGDPFEGAPHYY